MNASPASNQQGPQLTAAAGATASSQPHPGMLPAVQQPQPAAAPPRTANGQPQRLQHQQAIEALQELTVLAAQLLPRAVTTGGYVQPMTVALMLR